MGEGVGVTGDGVGRTAGGAGTAGPGGTGGLIRAGTRRKNPAMTAAAARMVARFPRSTPVWRQDRIYALSPRQGILRRRNRIPKDKDGAK